MFYFLSLMCHCSLSCYHFVWFLKVSVTDFSSVLLSDLRLLLMFFLILNCWTIRAAVFEADYLIDHWCSWRLHCFILCYWFCCCFDSFMTVSDNFNASMLLDPVDLTGWFHAHVFNISIILCCFYCLNHQVNVFYYCKVLSHMICCRFSRVICL